MIRPVLLKQIEEVVREWDTVSEIRDTQIRSGIDISYDQLLVPSILQLSPDLTGLRVLDAGCGSGVLSKRLAEEGASCVGVDPSGRSVALAQKFQSGPNISFFCTTLEDYAGQRDEEEQFDLVVANMVLMDVIDIESFCLAANSLLANQGSLIATVTHPCFWPKYWNYQNAEWFSYQNEIIIEAELRIHAGTTHHKSTHVHRPLSEYFRVAAKSGLIVDTLVEPWPPTDAPADYKASFTEPRFLGMRYRKSGMP